MSGAPARPVAWKSGAVISVPPLRGAPDPFVRPTTRSCSRSDERSHVSIVMRMRRATR